VRELAIQARAAGNVNLATERLEVALSLDPDDLETRVELVRLFERAGRRQDAAREQVKLAEAQAERGDISGALESFEEATVLAPDDLDILERILGLHERCGDTPSAVRVGHRLAEALVAKGCFEDARPLYERLLKRSPSLSLHESFAACLLKLDEKKQAAKHLLVVADAAFGHQQFGTALRHYQRVVEIDKANKQARERIETIESGKAQDRVRRRRRRKWYFLALIVVVGLAFQGFREWRAQGAWQEAQHATTVGLTKDNSDTARVDAIRRFAAVGGGHPFTRAGSFADETATEILEAEIGRIDGLLEETEKARSELAIRNYLLLIARQIERLDRVPLPDGAMKARWEESRDRLRKRFAALARKHQ
jgi:tetratricopeptide (TPR) repeat protein